MREPHVPIEYQKISSDIEKKLAGADLTADDLFRGHLHYGDKFTDPMGIYIVRRKKGYEIYHLNIHGIESVEKLSTEKRSCFVSFMTELRTFPTGQADIIPAKGLWSF